MPTTVCNEESDWRQGAFKVNAVVPVGENENSAAITKKLQIKLPCDSEIPLWVIYPE